jgi:2-hydroxy-6-oxo-octa-2,4-dienoate hydrolase
MSSNLRLPDIGASIDVDGIQTNYHEHGEGDPVILLHGSGPGVTAWQNWQGILPRLGETHRVLAPDIVGFGFSPLPEGEKPGIKLWTRHLAGFIDAMGLNRVILVGNSFGGALALGMMANHSDKVRSLVLMGTPAGEFEQTQGLANSRTFEPSMDAMRAMMQAFPYDPSIVTDEGSRIVKGIPLQQLDAITVPVLILHGREDKMIPLQVAVRMHEHLKRSEMHVFGQCGHWVQLEREEQFLEQVRGFFRNN